MFASQYLFMRQHEIFRNVGDDGVLIKPLEEIPCPFCRTEEFIRYDPFNKEYSMDSEEDIKDWYMSYINEMRNKYGGK